MTITSPSTTSGSLGVGTKAVGSGWAASCPVVSAGSDCSGGGSLVLSIAGTSSTALLLLIPAAPSSPEKQHGYHFSGYHLRQFGHKCGPVVEQYPHGRVRPVIDGHLEIRFPVTVHIRERYGSRD